MNGIAFYVESFGCQMNAYEAEVISSLLIERGALAVADPSAADCIVVNTCSVREHAERRAVGRLLDLSRHRGAVIAVCGCMAQRLGAGLFDRVPAVRVVAGPDSYARLPDAVERAVATGERFLLLDRDVETAYELLPAALAGGPSRYVSITRGCENFCSYCIVPYLRGPVRSRAADAVVRETSLLAAEGAREVTLLGQNVLAYRDGGAGFLDLLRRVLRETPIERLRFLTSHPRDVDPALFDLMAREERLCRHLHLPAQAGSDAVLAAMNRGYTRDRYLEVLAAARAAVPDLAVTSDLIVGFPGETEEDFRATVELVRAARFDSAFTFAYSPREGTPAAALRDDVTPETKKRRLADLNAVVRETREAVLREQIGSEAEILLDGAVEKGDTRFWKGRTSHFRNVLVRESGYSSGAIIRVKLARLVNYTFEGEPLSAPPS